MAYMYVSSMEITLQSMGYTLSIIHSADLYVSEELVLAEHIDVRLNRSCSYMDHLSRARVQIAYEQQPTGNILFAVESINGFIKPHPLQMSLKHSAPGSIHLQQRRRLPHPVLIPLSPPILASHYLLLRWNLSTHRTHPTCTYWPTPSKSHHL